MTARRATPATTATTADAILASIARAESEASFQARVVKLARLGRWRVYHTHDARHSAPGFPDLTLARGGRIIFAELKTQRGKVSAAQREWLSALAACPGVEVALWRPSDWPMIEAALIHGARLLPLALMAL